MAISSMAACTHLAILATSATATAAPSLNFYSSPTRLLPETQNHIRDHHHTCTRRGRNTNTATFAAKTGGFSFNSIFKNCQTCGGKGAIECPGCKGTGKNRKNGNIFERWKCFDCQGFGLKSCPTCGKGGLTPEQRGER